MLQMPCSERQRAEEVALYIRHARLVRRSVSIPMRNLCDGAAWFLRRANLALFGSSRVVRPAVVGLVTWAPPSDLRVSGSAGFVRYVALGRLVRGRAWCGLWVGDWVSLVARCVICFLVCGEVPTAVRCGDWGWVVGGCVSMD